MKQGKQLIFDCFLIFEVRGIARPPFLLLRSNAGMVMSDLEVDVLAVLGGSLTFLLASAICFSTIAFCCDCVP